MIVAVRPPEYFPRAALAALMLVADRFVVGDTLPYSRQSYQNRCRVRTPHPEDGWAWLTIPLEAGAPGTPVREVRVAPDVPWHRRHYKTLMHHLGSTPYWSHFSIELEAVLSRRGDLLAEVTVETVRWTAASLGVGDRLVLASELPGEPADVPSILAAAGATRLIALEESLASDERHASEAGARMDVLLFREAPRRQNFEGFVSDCGSPDLLLNHGPRARSLLQEGIEVRPRP